MTDYNIDYRGQFPSNLFFPLETGWTHIFYNKNTKQYGFDTLAQGNNIVYFYDKNVVEQKLTDYYNKDKNNIKPPDPNDPKIQMPNNGNPTLTQSEMFTAFAPIGAGLVTGLTSKYYYKRDTKKSLMYGLGATIGAGIIAHLYDSNLYPKLINSFAG